MTARRADDPVAAGAEAEGLVCLLGIDGSGKSTLLDAFVRLDPDVVVVDWQRIVATTAPYLQPFTAFHEVGPYARAAQLALIVALEYESVIAPALAQGRHVIADSYWYKLTAKVRLFGIAAPFLLPVCQALPSPSLVVFLDTPPAVAAQRRRDATVFEYTDAPADFVPFQQAMRDEMLRLVDGTPLEFVDGRLPPEETLRRFTALCERTWRSSACVRSQTRSQTWM